MIFVTGDCHGEFNKLSTDAFPEQKGMTKDDVVIICGDFGAVWDCGGASPSEKFWLGWLDEKPFTTVFVDGNHENFDRLNSEFETVDFRGGQAQRINGSVFRLLRGEVFDFGNRRFFAFGGAASHDISDGIISQEDFRSKKEFSAEVRRLNKLGKKFRINRVEWWEEELPSQEEFRNAEKNLAANNFEVDYVISHCAPQKIADELNRDDCKPDILTEYFDGLSQRLRFRYWFFGHYHENRKLREKYILLYDQIIRIL